MYWTWMRSRGECLRADPPCSPFTQFETQQEFSPSVVKGESNRSRMTAQDQQDTGHASPSISHTCCPWRGPFTVHINYILTPHEASLEWEVTDQQHCEPLMLMINICWEPSLMLSLSPHPLLINCPSFSLNLSCSQFLVLLMYQH